MAGVINYRFADKGPKSITGLRKERYFGVDKMALDYYRCRLY